MIFPRALVVMIALKEAITARVRKEMPSQTARRILANTPRLAMVSDEDFRPLQAAFKPPGACSISWTCRLTKRSN